MILPTPMVKDQVETFEEAFNRAPASVKFIHKKLYPVMIKLSMGVTTGTHFLNSHGKMTLMDFFRNTEYKCPGTKFETFLDGFGPGWEKKYLIESLNMTPSFYQEISARMEKMTICEVMALCCAFGYDKMKRGPIVIFGTAWTTIDMSEVLSLAVITQGAVNNILDIVELLEIKIGVAPEHLAGRMKYYALITELTMYLLHQDAEITGDFAIKLELGPEQWHELYMGVLPLSVRCFIMRVNVQDFIRALVVYGIISHGVFPTFYYPESPLRFVIHALEEVSFCTMISGVAMVKNSQQITRLRQVPTIHFFGPVKTVPQMKNAVEVLFRTRNNRFSKLPVSVDTKPRNVYLRPVDTDGKPIPFPLTDGEFANLRSLIISLSGPGYAEDLPKKDIKTIIIWQPVSNIFRACDSPRYWKESPLIDFHETYARGTEYAAFPNELVSYRKYKKQKPPGTMMTCHKPDRYRDVAYLKTKDSSIKDWDYFIVRTIMGDEGTKQQQPRTQEISYANGNLILLKHRSGMHEIYYATRMYSRMTGGNYM
jgi:hypothetical protein